MKEFDFAVIGSGIYGLYTAHYLSEKGYSVVLLERDDSGFRRASYINQARVHNGYHYPRSVATAKKSSSYFRRFTEEFGFAINSQYENIYAISSTFSETNAEGFKAFCRHLGIMCEEIDPEGIFLRDAVEAAFVTEEYSFSAEHIYSYLLEQSKQNDVEVYYKTEVTNISQKRDSFIIESGNSTTVRAQGIINTSYASVNQIIGMMGYDMFDLKYEICEIILCSTSDQLKGRGITVMDGPFFSVIPFGKTDLHSLTSVMFTPHSTSYNQYPVFGCQQKTEKCSSKSLYNCNSCPARPDTAFNYMSQLSSKYLTDAYNMKYRESLFSIKPILKSSEIDDSRPTAITVHNESPLFISILSGKINTIYDIEGVL